MKQTLLAFIVMLFSFDANAQKGYSVIKTFSLGDTLAISENESYFKYNKNYYQLRLQRAVEVKSIEALNRYMITDQNGNLVESGKEITNSHDNTLYSKMVQGGKQVGKRKFKKLSKSWPKVSFPQQKHHGGIGPK